MFKKLLVCGLLLIGLSQVALADDAATKPASDTTKPTPPPENPFKGSIQFGFTNLTGNTSETTYNGKTSATYKKNKWTNQGFVSAFSDDNDTSGDNHERYEVFEQTQYNYTEKKYAYINSDYLADSNDGYDYIWNSSVGYGRTLYRNDDYHMTLDGQAGPGYRVSPNDDSSVADESLTGNVAFIYKWQINKISSFQQDVSASYAETDTVFIYKTAYTANIYKNLGIQASFNVTQNTHVPADTDKFETITTLNVLYTF